MTRAKQTDVQVAAVVAELKHVALGAPLLTNVLLLCYLKYSVESKIQSNN